MSVKQQGFDFARRAAFKYPAADARAAGFVDFVPAVAPPPPRGMSAGLQKSGAMQRPHIERQARARCAFAVVSFAAISPPAASAAHFAPPFLVEINKQKLIFESEKRLIKIEKSLKKAD
jgi:hypothetical protein